MFPVKWKTASPLFKKGLSNYLNNYRPISILPTVSNLIENYVHDSFVEYFDNYKLLYNCQSGFRKQHSCETALIILIDKWLKALNDGDSLRKSFRYGSARNNYEKYKTV